MTMTFMQGAALGIYRDKKKAKPRKLRPGQFMDGDVVRSRCKHCGAVKQGGKCPVSDCARQRRK